MVRSRKMGIDAQLTFSAPFILGPQTIKWYQGPPSLIQPFGIHLHGFMRFVSWVISDP